MGQFNGKISAEFTPPKTWVLEKALSFNTGQLTDLDIAALKKIGANVTDTGRGSGRITCKKGMKTDLASVPRAVWGFISPWDVARAAVIHDHLYAMLREYYNKNIRTDENALKQELAKTKWNKGRELSDNIFLWGMQSAQPSVPKWKIYSAYWAVRLFGRWPASAKPKDESTKEALKALGG